MTPQRRQDLTNTEGITVPEKQPTRAKRGQKRQATAETPPADPQEQDLTAAIIPESGDLTETCEPTMDETVCVMTNRVAAIAQSHALIKQFTYDELKILLSLKRSQDPQAWTLREDLIALTCECNNTPEPEKALPDRNRVAVKRRLQHLRIKGLFRRQPGFEDDEFTEAEGAENII